MKGELPSGLAVHLAGRVRAARRRYRKRLASCQRTCSETAVHELRIETRRMLALLDLLEAMPVEARLRRLRKIFKKRLDAFDDLRDTHVQLRLLDSTRREFPEAKGFRRVLRERARRSIARLDRDIQTMKQARVNRQLKRIETILRESISGRSRPSGRALAMTAVRQAFRRVTKLRRTVCRDDIAGIHRLRVAFKRYRYMSELLRPVLAQLTARQLERMKRYQALAGDIQDIEVLLARLDRAVEEKQLEPGAIRGLRTGLARRQRRAVDLFLKLEIEEFKIGNEDRFQVPRRILRS